MSNVPQAVPFSGQQANHLIPQSVIITSTGTRAPVQIHAGQHHNGNVVFVNRPAQRVVVPRPSSGPVSVVHSRMNTPVRPLVQHHAGFHPPRPTFQTSSSQQQTVSSGLNSQANHNSQQSDAAKCKNFLHTLIKLSEKQGPETAATVKQLVQNLIDERLEPEEFTERLQKDLRSPGQPSLVPFLKKSLPQLRQNLGQKAAQLSHQRAPVQQLRAVRPSIQPQHTTVTNPNFLTQRMVAPRYQPRPANQIPITFQHSTYQDGSNMSSLKGEPSSPKHTSSGFKDEDDINDVTQQAGVNLTEEESHLLSVSHDSADTAVKLCKDPPFLSLSALQLRLETLSAKFGLEKPSVDVCQVISAATEERVRNLIEKVGLAAQHRLEIYKADAHYELESEVRPQLKFFEQYDKMEHKRKEDIEREMLIKAAKSRTKVEDPEQQRLRQRAKEMQQLEIEKLQNEEANLTALAAIGPRKKRRVDEPYNMMPAQMSSPYLSPNNIISNSMLGHSPHQHLSNHTVHQQISHDPTHHRLKVKRITIRDLLMVLEGERTSPQRLYSLYLKQQ